MALPHSHRFLFFKLRAGKKPDNDSTLLEILASCFLNFIHFKYAYVVHIHSVAESLCIVKCRAIVDLFRVQLILNSNLIIRLINTD